MHDQPNSWRSSDPNSAETQRVRARYDRNARIYDALEAVIETTLFTKWRNTLWQRVQGPNILELGVGTGKNFPFYPPKVALTGIDISPNMLSRASKRAISGQVEIDLLLGDAQALPFPDACFDTVVATFVFCSVPDPILGLREAHRVLVPGGQLLLLEHVLSDQLLLNRLMRLANPLVVRAVGANIDRRTVPNTQAARFRVLEVSDLLGDVVKLIVGEKE